MNASEIISYCVSIICVFVAIWQTRKNTNLKKYMKSEAMELYSDTGILLGSIQACMRELQTADTNLATQDIGRTEGMAQALFARSIKNIQHHFNFTRKDVDDWIEKRKIRSHHRDAFLTYAEK